MLNKFIFLLIGSAGPLLLWPVEYYLPYPHVIEELFKFMCLLWISKSEYKNKKILSKKGIALSVAFAVLFTLTESVLYLMNIAMLNQFELFPKRLLYTSILHITTTLIIMVGIQKKWYIQILTLALAIGIHFLYNSQI